MKNNNIRSHEDALIDYRQPLDDRAEYLLNHHLEQRERYANMRANTQLLIDMGRNALPLDLDATTPRGELLDAIKHALRLKDEYRASMRNADAAFRRMGRR